MTTNWIVYLCLTMGLASALVAGVFQAFSDFVMRGLVLARPSGGIESMQQINKTVLRSVFLTTFLLLVPATSTIAIYAVRNLDGPGRTLIIAATAIYVLTVFLVTMFGNVPMNERLAAMPAASEEAASYWSTYGRIWTRWNHVRSVGSAGAAVCFLLAAVSFT